MTRDEVLGFLGDSVRVGRLATVSAGGDPHVVPVWFEVDDGRVLVHTQMESLKAKNIAATGRHSFVVDVDTMPYKGASVGGAARIARDDEVDSLALVRRLAVAYLGPEAGPGFGEYIAAMPGEHVTLVLEVDHHESWDYSG